MAGVVAPAPAAHYEARYQWFAAQYDEEVVAKADRAAYRAAVKAGGWGVKAEWVVAA